MPPTRKAERDTSFSAVVTNRTPLFYEEGGSVAEDRPAHVRSGSGVVWLQTRERLLVIQDDASFVAFVDPRNARTVAVPIPWERDGMRQFDDTRGNKHEKLDLEACVVVPIGEDLDRVIAFGSGSSDMREKILIVDVTRETVSARIVDAHALYESLRSSTGFSGSELNIEGACIVGETLRLFQRGNGSPSEELLPIDATCDLSLVHLLAFLEEPNDVEVPSVDSVHIYDLNQIENVRLTFTDATMRDDKLYFLAAAEASPNAVDDGPVAGVVLGIASEEGVRIAPLTLSDGSLFLAKAEGLVANPYRDDEFFIVTDRDDPTLPSELCTLTVRFV